MMYRHLPVFVAEVAEMLAPVAGGTYIDATVGLGGHAEAMLESLDIRGRLIGIDRDERALSMVKERVRDGRLILIKGKFSELESLLGSEGIQGADGVLFDFGLSMMQLKDADRGFSFASEARLDMRMDQTQELTAWDVVNHYHEAELEHLIREYGEEFRARKIARKIVEYRQKKNIDTCSELAQIVASASGRRERIHPATRTFQALRIEVNGELDEIRKGLESAVNVLRPGGRLCTISYHSLEDRIAKNFIKDNMKRGLLRALTPKPVRPSREELSVNPSSRSAKLRGAEKI